jgi:4-hydroxybenzoate polyprenyltransferase
LNTFALQIGNDSRRAIRTLSVALGVNGCFLFAAVFALLGGLGVWIVLLIRGAYPAMVISALYIAGATYYTWRWYRHFATLSTTENQQMLMALSYANGLIFSLLFVTLVLLSG